MNKTGSGFLLATLLAASTFAGAVLAQTYPVKPIRVILPVPPGGVADVNMRATGQELTTRLGQSVVVENRPGASGIIASETCSKAVPDGYTLCVLYPDMTSFNPLFYPKLPYDPDNGFTPIVHLIDLVTAVTAPANAPFNTIAELKAYATANPGKLNFGSVGNGSEPHQFLEWLKHQWGVNIVHVAYKGGAPIGQALQTGEIQLTRVGVGTFIGAVRAGKLKFLAVGSKERSPLFPDVPTFTETGLDGYAIQPWFGLAGPGGLARPIVTRLNTEVVQIYADPKFRQQIIAQGTVPRAGSPEEFAAFLKHDRELAAEILKITKVRPD